MLEPVECFLSGKSRAIQKEEQRDGHVCQLAKYVGKVPAGWREYRNDDRQDNEDNKRVGLLQTLQHAKSLNPIRLHMLQILGLGKHNPCSFT